MNQDVDQEPKWRRELLLEGASNICGSLERDLLYYMHLRRQIEAAGYPMATMLDDKTIKAFITEISSERSGIHHYRCALRDEE